MAAIGELIHYYYYLCRKLNKIKKVHSGLRHATGKQENKLVKDIKCTYNKINTVNITK